jgi:hypothetical protein
MHALLCAGHGKFVRDPWAEVLMPHAANALEDSAARSDVQGAGGVGGGLQGGSASGAGRAAGVVGGGEGITKHGSGASCPEKSHGSLSKEGGEGAAWLDAPPTTVGGEQEERVEGGGLMLWLHQANRMFGKKPIREHEVTESGRERHKELAMLRGACPAPPYAPPTRGGTGPESPALVPIGASSPASLRTSRSSPVFPAMTQGASPTLMSLNPPAKAPLVTFLGSTHTIVISQRQHTGGAGGGRSSDGHSNDDIKNMEREDYLVYRDIMPSAALASAKSPATPLSHPASHPAVQSLLTLAEGLFSSPQSHSQEIAAQEMVQAEAVDVWEHHVLPKWDTARHDAEVLALWRKGLPPRVRRRVWQLAIGNELHITADDFRRCLALANYVAASGVEASGPDTRRRRPSARCVCECVCVRAHVCKLPPRSVVAHRSKQASRARCARMARVFVSPPSDDIA